METFLALAYRGPAVDAVTTQFTVTPPGSGSPIVTVPYRLELTRSPGQPFPVVVTALMSSSNGATNHRHKLMTLVAAGRNAPSCRSSARLFRSLVSMSAHWIVRAIRVSVVNGELANVIALALHGSAWLAEPSVTAPSLDQQNSTFRYVSRAQFESPQSRWRHTHLVSSSQSWLASLARDRVTRLWLVIPEAVRGTLEPHVAAGFSNGGQWGLLATGKRSSVWIPRWEVVDGNASDNRIWSVRFIGSEVKAPAAPSRPQTGPALTSLITALVDIREFARDRSLTLWADSFDDAIDRAEADSPAIPYHPDMAPQSR